MWGRFLRPRDPCWRDAGVAGADGDASATHLRTASRRCSRTWSSSFSETIATRFALVSRRHHSDETSRRATTALRQTGTIRERDRQLPTGVPAGDGHVPVEIFTETEVRARVMTARFDARWPAEGDVDSWRIVAWNA
jgi:hypothetical protein